MKTFLTLPTDKSFFDRYARLIPALKLSGYLGQVVSALTEVAVIYTAILGSLSFFSPDLAPYGATLGALLGVLIIECGLRVLLPYSVRAILYRRFSGLDLPITIIVWTACAVLLSAGTLMSYFGSHDVIDAVKPKPQLQDNRGAEDKYNLAIRESQQTYRADSTEIATRYAAQAGATQAQYAASIAQVRGQLQSLEAKERSGQRFSTAKAQARERLAALESEQATKLAALETAKAQELNQVKQRKTTAHEKATAALDRSSAKIEKANTKTIAEGDRKTTRYKGSLAWFTVLCHLILIVSIATSEIHAKGAGIEHKAVPTQYDFSDSIAGELIHALSNKWNQAARSWIRRIEEGTPPPPLPLSPNELYSLENLKQPVFNVAFEDLTDPNIVIKNRLQGNAASSGPATGNHAPANPAQTPSVPPPTANPGNGSPRRNGTRPKIAPGLLNGSSANGNGNGKHP